MVNCKTQGDDCEKWLLLDKKSILNKSLSPSFKHKIRGAKLASQLVGNGSRETNATMQIINDN